jgi:hypothetical protein
MGMGTRQAQQKQEEIWIANAELARSPGHPYYQRLNEPGAPSFHSLIVKGWDSTNPNQPDGQWNFCVSHPCA